MRTRTALLAIAALSLPAFGTVARQALPQPTPEQQRALQARWATLDRDRDGYLDRAEVAATPALSARFEQIDANRDARLSQQEMRASAEDRLGAADTNHDGAIDRAEAEAGLPRVARFFDRLDGDGDGRLTIEEVQRLAARFAGRQPR
jgi:Ca2+-binding EF-hand superfamily protein